MTSLIRKTHHQLKGYSLVELILVVAIITILSVAAYPFGAGFIARNKLKNITNEAVSSLRIAQINALSGKEDLQWGTYFSSSEVIMFSGDTYVSPGTSFDQKYTVPAGITLSATTSEVVFDKLTGNPNTTLTVTISNTIGQTNTISVNELGVVDVN